MDKQNKVGTQQKTKNKTTVASTVTLKDLGIEKIDRLPCKIGFSTWVRALMQNWRQGTVASKGRSDVALSTKKPWKQKGTGRARAGSARSPLWRGGGVTFGPQPRVRTLKISKKTKKRVLGDLLFDFLENKNIMCLNWKIESDRPKTSAAYKLLKNVGINSDRLIIFTQPEDFLTQASFSNIPNVNIMFFDQANAFDLTNGKRWVFLKKDFDSFKEMVSKWI